MPRLVKKKKIPDNSPIDYTAKQVSMMIGYALRSSSSVYSETGIRELAYREGLFTYVSLRGRKATHPSPTTDVFIPKSHLLEIIAGLEISLTLEDLEKAADGLGLQY